MKKILFGIALILFGSASFAAMEYGLGDFFEFFAVIFPIAGLGVSIWGLVEKDK